ncbi:MAG: pyridoxal phosphate-dependent aminotransferase family protein [Ginsengibacter sp.]
MIDFTSNDYLGMVRNNLITLPDDLCHGSSGSRLLSGNYPLIEKTEELIAKFHNCEAALIFNSGYDANIGLLSSIADRGDTIIYDQLSHASIRDGIRLSKADSYSFLHNDTIDLKKKIKKAKGKIFIITESVFSMDGDRAPVEEIIEIAKTHNAFCIIDEAHSVGVDGPFGEGWVQQLNKQNDCFARIVTFGKAVGAHGAAVLGSNDLRNFLINFSRSFIYTTALPESSVAAIKQSYQTFPNLHKERAHLKVLIECINNNPTDFKKSETPIQAFMCPGNENVNNLADKLKKQNFDVRPIRYPTVPKGEERLRIVLHSFNTISDLQRMLSILK